MRTTVVTGAGSGIGRAVAHACRARGDVVIGIDIREADIIADLSNHEGRVRAIDAVHERVPGAIDSVVACAGLSAGPADAIVAVNYFGAVELIDAWRPRLEASGRARVVAISSQAVMLPSDPDTIDACLAGDEEKARQHALEKPDHTYPSSKRALSLWIKRTAVGEEWAGKGIVMNAVGPGVVETAMTVDYLKTEKGWNYLNKTTPMRLGRPAKPAEIAALVAFMTSDDNSFMVGQTVFCDGGADATLRPEQI